jgi:hypothetical protein
VRTARSTYVDPVHASRQTWLRQRDGHAHAPPPAPSPPSPPRPVSLVKHTMAKVRGSLRVSVFWLL